MTLKIYKIRPTHKEYYQNKFHTFMEHFHYFPIRQEAYMCCWSFRSYVHIFSLLVDLILRAILT